MGLDISFSTKKALKAGLTVEVGYADNTKAREKGFDRPDRLEYTMAVPNAAHFVDAEVTIERIIVRANKWGSTYWPLTQWLTSHGIEWNEF